MQTLIDPYLNSYICMHVNEVSRIAFSIGPWAGYLNINETSVYDPLFTFRLRLERIQISSTWYATYATGSVLEGRGGGRHDFIKYTVLA